MSIGIFQIDIFLSVHKNRSKGTITYLKSYSLILIAIQLHLAECALEYSVGHKGHTRVYMAWVKKHCVLKIACFK